MKKILNVVLLTTLLLANSWSVDAKKPIKTAEIYVAVQVNSEPAGAQVYWGNTLVCPSTPGIANIIMQGEITPTNKKKMDQAIRDAKRKSSETLRFVKDGYMSEEVVLTPVITPQKVGFIKTYQFHWPQSAHAVLTPIYREPSPYETDTTIREGEAEKVVTRDNPGGTALERAIIRWYFESEPQGARIFWRVISSCPDEVKNTNELWLGTTPFEETRSFNILGLTYENSRDVQIEIKVRRSGYYDQTKRFNVRQAIDQQEISSFFDMVRIERESESSRGEVIYSDER